MGGLFDAIPLDKVPEAEAAVCVAAADIARYPRTILLQREIERRRPAGNPGHCRQGAGLLPAEGGQTMSDSLESLRRKMGGAHDLASVVRTMQALAASSIGQYETAVRSLGDYYRTVELGLIACPR